MEIIRFERVGNDCIIYTTLILDKGILIVIERFGCCWCDNTPNVSVYTENARDKFNEFVEELKDKGESK